MSPLPVVSTSVKNTPIRGSELENSVVMILSLDSTSSDPDPNPDTPKPDPDADTVDAEAPEPGPEITEVCSDM